MSEDVSPIPPALIPAPTAARFSTRAILWTMAIVAVVAASIGPIVRGLDPNLQLRLLTIWGLLMLGVLLATSYQARGRFKAERLAGGVYFMMPMFDERMPEMGQVRRSMNILGAAFLALLMLFSYSTIATSTPVGVAPSELMAIFFTMFASIWWLSKIVATLWWRNNIRICENGVLWERRLLLWDHIVEHQWATASVLELKGIDQNGVDLLLKIPVPYERYHVLKSIIEAKIVREPSLPDHPSEVDLGRVSITQAVHSEHLLPYLARFFFGFALIVVFIFYGMEYKTGVPEFDDSMVFGFILFGFFPWLLWQRQVIQAGPPLVRMAGRPGWFEWLLAVSTAAALYAIGANFGWTSVLLAYATGVGFGAAAAAVFSLNIRRQLDLRENAVVLMATYCWQWNATRLARWNNTTGRLVLARGWRRIIARVPPEQREAVEAVLKEKLRPAVTSSAKAPSG
jgi:hypothetical protein